MNHPIVRRLVSPLVGLLLACFLLAGPTAGQEVPPVGEAKPAVAPAAKIAVAIYNGPGAGGKGPEMLAKTFGSEADVDFKQITVDDIRAGKLKDFRILIVPGGSSSAMGKALGEPGREAIRGFVKDGGTYVGICAGCYLSSCQYPWSLNILPAKIVDPANSYRGRAMLQLEPTPEGKEWLRRADLKPKSVYHNGPVLEALSDAKTPLVPLAYYREEITKKGAKEGLMVNTPAIAAAAYGKGWAVGVSPHPEQTEGLKDIVPSLIRWASSRPAKE